MIPKSRAVLSSGLRAGERRSIARGAHYAHLAASEDEALLRWRHARLLLDLLLDACDLCGRRQRAGMEDERNSLSSGGTLTLSSRSISSSIYVSIHIIMRELHAPELLYGIIYTIAVLTSFPVSVFEDLV